MRPSSPWPALLLLCAPLLLARPPAATAGEEGPKPAEVSAAIDRGVAWLHKAFEAGFEDASFHDLPELVVLTLAHCGANLKDKVFAAGLEKLEQIRPRFTYRASLQAMALAEVNPRLYEKTIAHCAQWLVDMQLPGGEWGYPGAGEGMGAAVPGVLVEPPPAPEAPKAEGAKPGAKPAARARYVIQRRSSTTSDRVEQGDFSNTQLAILGLRACREAGIDLPKETWAGALAYLRKFQREDGGFGYVVQGEQDGVSYASLTCAGVCSLAICLAAQGNTSPKSDPGIKKALAWLDKRLDVATNVGVDQSSIIGISPWQYYHLYSLERAARALNLEKVGKHAWYPEGAAWLLGAQRSDGSWQDTEGSRGSRPAYLTPADTCFALLFLTRKTRPVTGN